MVQGLTARLTFTLPSVFVLLVYKATLLLHVLRQDVAAIMNVIQMKFVILLLVVDLPVKNAKPFVTQGIVLEELIVQPRIIEKPVHADFH